MNASKPTSTRPITDGSLPTAPETLSPPNDLPRGAHWLRGAADGGDPRLAAVRGDLADIALAGRIFVPHYAVPEPRTLTARSPLRTAAAESATAGSELMAGETFMLLDVEGSWAWGFSAHDHYVGHLPAALLGPAQATPFAVTARAALVFAERDMKSALRDRLPMGTRLAGTVDDGGWLALPGGGHVHPRHFRPLAATGEEPAELAERLIGAPYLWGGRSGDGLDCSGLLQMVHGLAGIALPRDSDQQAAEGVAVASRGQLRRGDAVFFPGHVGLMLDGERMIHANAHWMAVTAEPLDAVVARFANPAAAITAMRRFA